MFYIPSVKPAGNVVLAAAEYWIDDDYASKVSIKSGDVEQSFSIDISTLSSGVHYFNYRAIDSEGRYGNPIRQLFYISRMPDVASGETSTYEYWIDDDLSNKVTGESTQSEYVFNIDVSSLSVGKHKFNFRAKNWIDSWGEPFYEEFEIVHIALVGDVNNDGFVGIGDIVSVTDIMAGIINNEEYVKRADVNGDGVVGIGDIVAITNIMAGIAN